MPSIDVLINKYVLCFDSNDYIMFLYDNPQKEGLRLTIRNPSSLLARPIGLEPMTYGLEGRCSIQLSYERMLNLILPAGSWYIPVSFMLYK